MRLEMFSLRPAELGATFTRPTGGISAAGIQSIFVFLRSVLSRGHEYVLLVQTYREEGKVRQKVVRYFGRRDHLDMEQVRAFVRNLEAGRAGVHGRVKPVTR